MVFDSIIGTLPLYNHYQIIILLVLVLFIINFSDQDDILVDVCCYYIILYFFSYLPIIMQAYCMHFLNICILSNIQNFTVIYIHITCLYISLGYVSTVFPIWFYISPGYVPIVLPGYVSAVFPT